MKYGIFIRNNDDRQIENYDSASFYQWLNVFQGRVIPADDALSNLKDGDFDIIHIRLLPENLLLIHQLREKLGLNSYTKIVLSLDIPMRNLGKKFERPDQLKAAVGKADFVFAAEYSIAQALEAISGRKIYEIPHPANIDKIKHFENSKNNNTITIFWDGQVNIKKYITHLKFFFKSNVNVSVLSHRNSNNDDIEFYRKKNIDFTTYRNEEELWVKLAESRFILIPEIHSFIGNEYYCNESLVIYSAIIGTIILNARSGEAMRRCYPEILSAPIKNYLLLYRWIKDNKVKMNNLIEYAQIKAESYHWGNLQKRFLDRLYDETQDERFYYRNIKIEYPSLFKQIHHIHGERTVYFKSKEEFAVVCLVKNGAEYIKAFIDHYNCLGAKHFFFIDNGSTDGTIRLLKQYQNITIYQTELPHKRYECEIRRAVIEEHCRNNWCLCVDIDEFFDYPYSDRISMQNFLRYLNSHQYTAVLSYLLDMFSKELDFSPKKQEDIVNQYCYYDISNIKKSRYHSSFKIFTNHNQLSDKKMKNYSGGIRRNVFKNKESGYLLTKHPLIFVNSKIEPMVHPHFCNKAFIADVNGVVKHYKFISSFKDKVIRSLESKDYCYYAEQEYKEYFNIIKDKDSLSLYSRKSEKLENAEQLFRQGFLRVSKIYRAYVKLHQI